MRISFFILTICLLFQGLCLASDVPLLQDTPVHIDYRLSVANSNLHALHNLLPRIQSTIPQDPEKACDLICNAMKYLVNIEEALGTTSTE